MAGYTRIILPLDGSEASEQALPHVAALAARLSLPVQLLFAVEPDSPAIAQSLYAGQQWNAPESTRAARAEDYLERIAASMSSDGLQVETNIPLREPANAIVEEASENPGALIVMASHGRSGLARWWMGSVADKVLHLSDNPLVIVRVQDQSAALHQSAPERLIVPLDGSEMAELSLPHVAFLATAMDLPVKLLQIVPSESEYYSYMAIGPGVMPTSIPSSPSIQEMIEMADRKSQGYLADVTSRLTGQGVGSVQTQVVMGTPADSIVDLATAETGAMVVMTTHGRTGVGRMMLGSVAERVVRQSGCPVLLVRAGHAG